LDRAKGSAGRPIGPQAAVGRIRTNGLGVKDAPLARGIFSRPAESRQFA
jgi:hypothetical protein